MTARVIRLVEPEVGTIGADCTPRLLGECARYLFEVKESRQVRAPSEVLPHLMFQL
jgi:hypothetical protein